MNRSRIRRACPHVRCLLCGAHGVRLHRASIRTHTLNRALSPALLCALCWRDKALEETEGPS